MDIDLAAWRLGWVPVQLLDAELGMETHTAKPGAPGVAWMMVQLGVGSVEHGFVPWYRAHCMS